MEKIEIRVERQQGAPVQGHWHALFGVAGGTIGRGGQNKLVLPDEDAGVARVHAMVRLESEGAFIANLCERRSMQLNGVELCSGQELRLAVQGTIDLMAARSEIKREFRADVTLINSGANNPLKFLPTAEGVILQILGRSFPGFMPPVPAMKEAYRDLQLHQLALMAGIRAAYVEALTRFDPVALEKQLPVSDSVIGRWSATRRKAALWDGYRQSYLDIRRHAEDDLMAFSGRTFVQAYEAAVEAAGPRT